MWHYNTAVLVRAMTWYPRLAGWLLGLLSLSHLLSGGILQQNSVHLFSRQLHIPHNWATNEAVPDRQLHVGTNSFKTSHMCVVCVSACSAHVCCVCDTLSNGCSVFNTMWGYLSGSGTLISFSFTFRYWRGENRTDIRNILDRKSRTF